MQVFNSEDGTGRIWFDNLTDTDGRPVAYDPTSKTMCYTFDPCGNRDRIGCNWVAPDAPLCSSCMMTRTYPDLAIDENTDLWRRAEAAKRWVLANLADLGWFTATDPGLPPVFDFLSEAVRHGLAHPVMGHADGVITINVAEARPAEIVARREAMGEPYRTMIGHLRHELAHLLQLRLSAKQSFVDSFRALFGDEREDYAAALKRHYAAPDTGAWRAHFISHYASSHPHEDWAETTAHVLHLLDILDSARAVGLFTETKGDWLTRAIDLGIALNHMSRSMGLSDIYPFVVTDTVRAKIEFAYDVLASGPPDKLVSVGRSRANTLAS